MLKHLCLAAVLAVAPAPLNPAAINREPAPSLTAYLDYPYLGQLVASPAGDRIAWVETHRGVRNVWVADAPGYTPRAVTQATADDGQALAGLAFSPDGHVLVWTRGGGEAAGWTRRLPPPNPGSAVEQPQLEIWASRDGGAPVRLATGGSAPAVSARGEVAYLKEGQVWSVPADGSRAPARLFYDRWSDGALAWSPDGSRLAFVSRRGDHSFVGVYAGRDRPLVWMAPRTAYDEDPAWSPDGTRLAFSRRFGQADYLNLPLVERPNPFSIWVASPDDGSGRQLWESPATLNGSYPLIAGGFYLMWGAGDRLTFRAELDGYTHLYALSTRGGEPRLLTPGHQLAEHVTMAPDGRTLFYSSNDGRTPGDIDRRHVFRVGIAGGTPVALTGGSGSEWTPVPLGREVGYIAATPVTPMRIAVAPQAGGGARMLATPASAWGINDLVVPSAVTLTAADGTTVHAQLFTPKRPGPHPALVFVHGGPGRQMLLGWSDVEYYAHAYAMNQYLTRLGFVVLSVNYRLGIGYGRAFQHAAKAGIAGNAEYQDVLAGAHYLQGRRDVDPARLGIWGGSYGGLLTAQALARNSDIFKAGVDFHGVHDWSLFPGIAAQPRRYERGDESEAMATAFRSSPEAALAHWTSPVLLIAGDDDRNVPFEQTVDLARKLRAQGTPFEELILPDEIHGFLRYRSWLAADRATAAFLTARLKP